MLFLVTKGVFRMTMHVHLETLCRARYKFLFNINRAFDNYSISHSSCYYYYDPGKFILKLMFHVRKLIHKFGELH